MEPQLGASLYTDTSSVNEGLLGRMEGELEFECSICGDRTGAGAWNASDSFP